MTELVVEAERRGDLPPTRISPDQLQQQCCQPTLPELRAAFGLHRLSRAIATCICSRNLIFPNDRPAGPFDQQGPTPEDPARMHEWTARVSHAVFRLLIVGAALAGAYKEPLFKALEHPDPEIQALPRHAQDDGKGYTVGQKEMAFLLQFAVCDLDATMEAQDAVFGPIAEWLLESILSDSESRQAMADRFAQGRGRAGFCLYLAKREEEEEEEDGCPVGLLPDHLGSHSDAHLVVWELMKVFWLVDQVLPYYSHGVLRRHTPRPSSKQSVDADNDGWGPLESAVAVFFGMFRAEETLLTTTPLQGRPGTPITFPAVSETKKENHSKGKLPSSMSVTVFFDDIFNYSGRPNHIEETGDLVAPLELKFFEYFLQRHLGLCFNAHTFKEIDGVDFVDQSYQEFVGTATIFSHDDVENRCSFTPGDSTLEMADFLDGSEILTKYPPDFTRFYQERRE